ncbi:unnamed protein product, partial [Iphiclides podalirius]
MRVFAILAIIVASVAARGSGPYLPSGWKPDGPAFYLPSEVQKPKEKLIQENVIQESEASGSNSFQEYGPPKVEEISLELSKQGLPDAITEQTFAVIDVKAKQVDEEKIALTENQVFAEDSEGKSNEQSLVQEIAPVTEALPIVAQITTLAETEENVENIDTQLDFEATTQFIDETTTIIAQTKSQPVQLETADVETEQKITENKDRGQTVKSLQQENDNANSDIVSTIEERLQVQEIQTVKEEIQQVDTEVKRVETEIQKVETQVQNFETEVKNVEHLVQNIPELLTNIDNEVKEQQAENLQQISETKAIQETSGSLEQAPEGFLEYGPPGFKEYGPPKEDLLRTIYEVIPPELQSIESDYARRRRFSPKLR